MEGPDYNSRPAKTMKAYQKAILGALVALLLLSLTAVLLTRGWANYRERLRAMRIASGNAADLVDTHALDTAQQAAALAVTDTEQGYALEAMRLADHSVDLAFAAAMKDAADNPPPSTPAIRQSAARVKAAESSVATDQDLVAQLTQKVAKARRRKKRPLQDALNLAQAQLSLDQDELAEAHQDLIRAGGDRQAIIQKQLDRHEASAAHASKTPSPGSGAAAATSATTPVELTKASTVWAQLNALLSLRAKEKLLREAEQNALARSTGLSASRDALQKEFGEEKAQKKILHGKAREAPAAGNPETAAGGPEPNEALSYVRLLAEDQKTLITFNKRIEGEQQLARVYSNWIAYVRIREKAFLHGLLLSTFWVLLIGLFVFMANQGVQRFFGELTPERRDLHTLRAVSLFALQAIGVVLILLVIFGMPGNFAAVVALMGAGLTVALKDFIVGFLGWFILMGKDGIRPGDWVEINGVGGEVLGVGPLHTVLLETGNWTDAGHPTGRKVTFVNSFAIEGHYFNFSTSGQWLWDELQVLVPPGSDAYAFAEALQKVAADDTATNAKLAEQEWDRVTPGGMAKRSFSAAPAMSVRPTPLGVNVLMRYITRASERHEVRARLYRAAVELLNKKYISEAAAEKPSVQSASSRG
jgi:small-conductance mechanosensitive channel